MEENKVKTVNMENLAEMMGSMEDDVDLIVWLPEQKEDDGNG